MGLAIRGATSQTRRARLLAKVYEVDPMVCPGTPARADAGGADQRKCCADMKCRDRSSDCVLRYDPDVIAVIEDPDQSKRILRHLIKIGRSPPGFDPDRRN